MITTLEKQSSSVSLVDPQKQSLWKQLETNKQELEITVEYQTKGAILRSNSRWDNEGEKNIKYFLNLEMGHCKQATITQLRSNDQDIYLRLKIFTKFDLYASKAGEEDIDAFPFPSKPEEKTLTEEKRAFFEGSINEKECLKGLNSMPSIKTLGTDELPCEFIKFFGVT